MFVTLKLIRVISILLGSSCCGGQAAGFPILAQAPSVETFAADTSAQRKVALPRKNIPGGAQPEEVLGSVNQNRRINRPSPPCVNLSGSHTLGFAISPHARRYHQSAPLQCDSESGAGESVSKQIREFAVGPTRKHMKLIGKLGTALAKTLRHFGRCFYPQHCTYAMSSEIFGPREIRRNRRPALRN